jgi:hypothetical protein
MQFTSKTWIELELEIRGKQWGEVEGETLNPKPGGPII